MSKKKKRRNNTVKPEAPPPAAPGAGIDLKSVVLWLALTGMIVLVLCVLESVKITLRDGI